MEKNKYFKRIHSVFFISWSCQKNNFNIRNYNKKTYSRKSFL